MESTNLEIIEKMIYVIRGQKVMLDSDLAQLYGVETGHLNRAIKRNINRFPSDFMFQLTAEETESLIFQIGVSNVGRGGRRYLPMVFTEQGLAMLSSVLNSDTAIMVNISIMRTFVRLRSFLAMESDNKTKLDKHVAETEYLFKIVFKRLDNLDSKIEPKLSHLRKRIGLKRE